MARRTRTAEDYRRRGPVREQYDVVLIVCEGEKTEPGYFPGLRAALRLSSANISVVPAEYGNDPLSVVRYAQDEYARARGDFNRVYCVFDRDGHATYDQALRRVAESELGRNGTLIAISSAPCFEVWVFLHYIYTTAPYRAAGGRSACDRVIAAIREHLPDYDKGFQGMFDQLWPQVENAMRHAAQLERHNRGAQSDNPATKVHELVNYLRKLRDVQ